MARLLLNLRNVPDDEADEIRSLLEASRIEFYETPPSRWGISAGRIWVGDRDTAARAEVLLAEYQRERQVRARDLHRAAVRQGSAKTVWRLVRERPLSAVGVLLVIVFIIVILLLPFLLLAA